MKEPQKFSMSTGLPNNENEEVKKYPLQSVEKELHDLIEDSKEYLSKKEAAANFIKKVKESKKKYNERLTEKNKDST